MYCPTCGAKIEEHWVHCPRCGAKIAHQKPTMISQKIEETRHQERSSMSLTIIGAIMIAVGGIIGIIPTATRRSGDYIITYHPYADTAIAILILGCISIFIGVGINIYYTRRRNRLLRQYETQEKQD